MSKKQQLTPEQWDIMVEYTKGFLYMIGYLAVICIVLMIIKDVM
tara:strand:+ start:1588 stop:1719 length:132 start_codon:yes stop_codon:yes gene_type:complete